jgi:hypothetical protein
MIPRLRWCLPTALAVVLLLCPACPEEVVQLSPPGDDDDDDTTSAGDDDDSAPADADGDGYTVADGDCDDTDANVHPGAEEICDGKDNDCNGQMPEDDIDQDGDGYPPCSGDCDDEDPLVSPGVAEIPYDGIDNNCSEGDFTDVDQDGHDWEGVDGGDDCDDNNQDVYPGADEIAGDGLDSNCDGFDDIPLGSYCADDDNTMTVPGLTQFNLSSWSDADNGPAGPDHYLDDIEFEAEAGWSLTISMLEDDWYLDPYLYLLDMDCQVIAEDDNSWGEGADDALIAFEVSTAGVYTIIATSAGVWQTGTYTIQIGID